MTMRQSDKYWGSFFILIKGRTLLDGGELERDELAMERHLCEPHCLLRVWSNREITTAHLRGLLITERVKAFTFKEFNCIAIAMLEWQNFRLFLGGRGRRGIVTQSLRCTLFLHFQSLQVNVKGDNKGNI